MALRTTALWQRRTLAGCPDLVVVDRRTPGERVGRATGRTQCVSELTGVEVRTSSVRILQHLLCSFLRYLADGRVHPHGDRRGGHCGVVVEHSGGSSAID